MTNDELLITNDELLITNDELSLEWRVNFITEIKQIIQKKYTYSIYNKNKIYILENFS